MAEEKSTRIVVKNELADSWDDLRSRSGMSQQDIFDRMLRFLFLFDETAQAMILGQVPASDDLIEIIMRRLSDDDDESPGGTLAQIGPKPPKPTQSPGSGRVKQAAKKKLGQRSTKIEDLGKGTK